MTQTTSRKPLKVVKNGARPEERWTGSISGALHRAIHTLSAEQLRQEVNTLGLLNRVNNEHLWKRLTVPGKEVVRYHVDTDSEDASGAESEEEGEEEESASDSDAREDGDSGRKETKPIAIRNDEMTPRYANCENCNEEFDVTLNERGDCVWHSGTKGVYYDGDFWADHDPDCHGEPRDFKDDTDFAEGFVWDCCNKPGDEEGCKSTKHKAKVNIIAPPAPIIPPKNIKRRSEEAQGGARRRRIC